MDKFDNCLAKLLNVIKVIQDNAKRIDCNDNTCTKPFLGLNNTTLCFNTRPIILYRCNNEPITLNYTNSEGTEATIIHNNHDAKRIIRLCGLNLEANRQDREERRRKHRKERERRKQLKGAIT